MILEEATHIIYGDREKTYGTPAFNLETIAEFWRIWLERRHNVKVGLLPDDVAAMMALMKMSRLLQSIDHHDSQVDVCGYIALLERIQHPLET
jgi:hypothetical protein